MKYRKIKHKHIGLYIPQTDPIGMFGQGGGVEDTKPKYGYNWNTQPENSKGSKPKTVSKFVPSTDKSLIKTLKPVNIYAAKDEYTHKTLNELADKNEGLTKEGEKILKEQGKFRPFTNAKYDRIWKSWMDNGTPNIRPLDPNNLPEGRVWDYGAHYYRGIRTDTDKDSKANTMFIRPFNKGDYFAELSHAKQNKDGGGYYESDWNKYPTRDEYDAKAYNDTSATEYKAHKIIEPQLIKKYDNNMSLTNDEIAEYINNRYKILNYTRDENLSQVDKDRISNALSFKYHQDNPKPESQANKQNAEMKYKKGGKIKRYNIGGQVDPDFQFNTAIAPVGDNGGGRSYPSDNPSNNQGLSTGQYVGAGLALVGGAAQYSQSKTREDKFNSLAQTEIGVAGSIAPVWGLAHQATTSIMNPLTAKATRTDDQGNLVNRRQAKNQAIGRAFADPIAFFGSNGLNWNRNRYADRLENDAKTSMGLNTEKPYVNPVLPYSKGGPVKKKNMLEVGSEFIFDKQGNKAGIKGGDNPNNSSDAIYGDNSQLNSSLVPTVNDINNRLKKEMYGSRSSYLRDQAGKDYQFIENNMLDLKYLNNLNQQSIYAQGGQVNSQLINVEGQELEVDPQGNIVKDFKNKPPHPIQGINPDGNIMATEGNIIIPKNLRKSYLTADRMKRKSILASLSMLNPTQMYGNGGTIDMYQQGAKVRKKPPTTDPNGNYRTGDYSDPTGNKDWTYYKDKGDSWIGISKGVETPLNYSNPKYKNSLDILNNYWKGFQAGGGGGSSAWDNYIQANPYQANTQTTSQPYQHKNFNYPNTTLNYGAQPKASWNGGYSGQTQSYMNPSNIPNTGMGTYNPSTGSKEGNPDEPRDWKNIANNTVPYVGDAAQLAYNAFSKAEYPNRMRNKEYNKSVELMANRRYDISGQLRSNREGLGAFNYAVRNSSGGNAGMYLNQMSNGQNNFNSANSNAWAMKNNMDNQYKGEEASFRAGLGAQDTAYGYQHEDDKFQAQATRRNNMFGAAQNIGKSYMQMNALGTIDKYGPYAVDPQGNRYYNSRVNSQRRRRGQDKLYDEYTGEYLG